MILGAFFFCLFVFVAAHRGERVHLHQRPSASSARLSMTVPRTTAAVHGLHRARFHDQQPWSKWLVNHAVSTVHPYRNKRWSFDRPSLLKRCYHVALDCALGCPGQRAHGSTLRASTRFEPSTRKGRVIQRVRTTVGGQKCTTSRAAATRNHSPHTAAA